MLAQVFDDLIADAVDRVQARHWFLKDHCHAVAHNGATIFFWQRQQIHPLKANAAASDPHCGPTQQAHDRQRCQAFATAAFANDAQGFIVIDTKENALGQLARACPLH